MKKIAVILSGCGNRDGSEIQETMSVLLAINRMGMQYVCFAPEMNFKAVDYLSGQKSGEERNVLTESARMVRGQVKALNLYKAEDFDALVFPGGMGAALNLSDFGTKGEDMEVVKEIREAIERTYELHKPIAAICIAPVVLAKVLGKNGICLTFGEECEASKVAEKLGARHIRAEATEVVVDRKHKILTTPAYMVAENISQIFEGGNNIVRELKALLD